MATLDILTVALYFVLLIGIAIVVFRKRQKTSDDYFLAGRSVPWYMVMGSLYATDMSSLAFISLNGAAVTTGIAFANFQWVAVFCILILVIWLLPIYLRNRIVTLPEFLQRRYGSSAQIFYSLICIAIYLTVEIPLVLYASSLLLGQVTNLDHKTIFIVLGVITGTYAALGGLRAVIYADFMQSFFILAGGLYIAIISLNAVGGWSGLQQNLPPKFFSALQPISEKSDLPWPAVVTGLVVIGIWYWCTNQMILQRVLGARSINEARLGTLGAGVLKFTLPPMLALPGMAAAVLFSSQLAGNNDNAFGVIIHNLVPVGLKGLVVAAFVAAMMSHAEGALNSASTLYVQDIHKRFFAPNLPDASAIRLGKIVGFLILLFGLIMGLQISGNMSIYVQLQKGYSYAAAPAVVLFLGGIFWKRANLAGAWGAYIGGLGTMAAIEWYNKSRAASELPGINPFYQVAWAALAGLVVFVLASLMTPKPSQAQEEVRAPYEEEPITSLPLLKRWPIWAGVCAMMLIATYIAFH